MSFIVNGCIFIESSNLSLFCKQFNEIKQKTYLYKKRNDLQKISALYDLGRYCYKVQNKKLQFSTFVHPKELWFADFKSLKHDL